MIDKLNSYMLSQVKEYWVVDPNQETIIIYSFDNNEIDRIKSYEKGDFARSLLFDGLLADVDNLFSELI
jgi:Uma2 family endonuclease